MGEPSRPDRLNNLKAILEQMRLRHPAFSKRLSEAQAVQKWSESVGAHIARHTDPLFVKDGTLWVAVDHPIWKAELLYRKAQVIEKLNSGLRENERILDLQFTDRVKNRGE